MQIKPLSCTTQTEFSFSSQYIQHGLVSRPIVPVRVFCIFRELQIIYKPTSQIDQYCCFQLLLRSVPFTEPKRVNIVIRN